MISRSSALNELPRIEELFDRCSRMMQTITALPQPVIARVQGAAAAAGCRARRAVRPGGGLRGGEVHHARRDLGLLLLDPGVAVGRNVSRKRAMEMLLTGDMVDAHQALDWGRAQPRRAGRALVAETGRLARQLAEKPPVQLAAGSCSTRRWISVWRRPTSSRLGGDCRELRPPGGTGRHGCLHREARPTGPVTAATVAPRPPPRPAHRASWNPSCGGRR